MDDGVVKITDRAINNNLLMNALAGKFAPALKKKADNIIRILAAFS